MHSEIVATIARQHVAEHTAAAERRHRQDRTPAGPATSRPSLRTRIGWTLVRWGQRLAPPPTASSVPSRRPRAATMGA